MNGTATPAAPGVAVTRPGPDPGRLGDLLRSAGARVVHWPSIRFDPPADPEPLATAVRRLQIYDWLVVTSPRAARRWAAAWRAAGREPPGPGGPGVRTAAVGPATAATLREAGWPVDRIAASYSAAGLVETFAAAGDVDGTRVLVPCSDRADDVLPAGLRSLGADVDRVVAYRTVPTPPDPGEVRTAAATRGIQVVTFTSPSTVEGFLGVAESDPGLGAEIRRRFIPAAIGPTTAAALEGGGWPAVVAEEATLEALASAALRAARHTKRESGAT